ncbi:MAG TPA: SGNH/GDSL hydrolase family protein [Candidatus Limnocylindrales bacterium]|nr:SGNH/GDSL hydrolase family protein [Candidatus Limnocylindrales bacterium]
MIRKVLLAMSFAGALVVVAELALQKLAPPPNNATATIHAPKARHYGWAWPPEREFVATDPDTGERFRVRTNREGWKDVDHQREKPPGVVRVLVLGDSHTWGFVPLEQLYTRRLEALLAERGLSQVEVITLAVGGWGTDQQLEALTVEGLSYDPDIVIYQFCGNDVLNNVSPNGFISEDRMEWYKTFRYELEGDRLRRVELTPRSVIPLEDRLRNAVNRTALGYYAGNVWTRLRRGGARQSRDYAKAPPLPGQSPLLDAGDPFFLYGSDKGSEALQEAWRLLEALLVEMKKRTQAAGAELYVFSEEGEAGKREHNLATRRLRTDKHGDFVMRDSLRLDVRWSAPLDRLREICGRAGIPLIEPRRTYTRFRVDPHPNRQGNEAMAHDIADALMPRLSAIAR